LRAAYPNPVPGTQCRDGEHPPSNGELPVPFAVLCAWNDTDALLSDTDKNWLDGLREKGWKLGTELNLDRPFLVRKQVPVLGLGAKRVDEVFSDGFAEVFRDLEDAPFLED